MRVLIVDDEPAARQRLALLLEELDVEVVGEAANGVVALELMSALRPDLLLLDITMPEVDGFDVARHLPEPRPLIVFQTAYDEHALQAFEHAAIDYLVKPVAREKLERALRRAAERLGVRVEPSSYPQLEPGVVDALRQALGAPAHRARLLVRDRGGHRLLPYTEVLRCSAAEGVAYAHTASERYLTDYTLTEIEARAGEEFVRTSRAELVNLDHVVRFASSGDGSAILTLSDGSTVQVSRRRGAEVRRALLGGPGSIV